MYTGLTGFYGLGAVASVPPGFPDWLRTFDIGRIVLGPGFPAGSQLRFTDWAYMLPAMSLGVNSPPSLIAEFERAAAATGYTLQQLMEPHPIGRGVLATNGGLTQTGIMWDIPTPPPSAESVMQVPAVPNLRFPGGRNAYTGETLYTERRVITWGSSIGVTPETTAIPFAQAAAQQAAAAQAAAAQAAAQQAASAPPVLTEAGTSQLPATATVPSTRLPMMTTLPAPVPKPSAKRDPFTQPELDIPATGGNGVTGGVGVGALVLGGAALFLLLGGKRRRK